MNDAMTTDMFEELVRARAYALWESEGRPFGRHAEHWRASEEEARAELALASVANAAKPPKPKAAPRKKPVVKSAALALETATRH
jgi:hypothetical protein